MKLTHPYLNIYIYIVETYIKKLIDWSTVIIYTFQEQLDSISQR